MANKMDDKIPLLGHLEYATLLQDMQRYNHLSDDEIKARFADKIEMLKKYEAAYS